MGYALITGGGTDGRYTVDFDYGAATQAAILANLDVAQVNLNAKLAEQQLIVAECDARELAARENLVIVQEAIIADMAANAGEFNTAAMALYTDLAGKYRLLQASHLPARQALATIKSQLAECYREITRYGNAVTTETREAWCCDLTEDAAGYVATVDVPGETNLMLIAPGGRAWTAADGVFTAREIMSPAQAYFNAAILPGWQKFLPTYRWGTLTDINRAANTGDLDLFASTSSAQRLGVNQAESLEDVTFEYMACDNRAFEVGDRVVVAFTGQDWSQPKIIGFVDAPRGCPHSFAGMRPRSATADDYFFFVRIQSELDRLMSAELLVQMRLNYGEWINLALGPTPDSATVRTRIGTVPLRSPGDVADPNADIEFSIGAGQATLDALETPETGPVPTWVKAAFTARCEPTIGFVTGGDVPSMNDERAEFRVYLGGELYSNFVIKPQGWAQEGYVKAKIKNMTGILDPLWGLDWFELLGDEYTLDSEATP